VGRRALLVGTGAALVAAACGSGSGSGDRSGSGPGRGSGPGGDAGGTASTGDATAPAERALPRREGEPAWRGVNYDVGTEYVPGIDSREVWRAEYVEGELTAIRDELRCDSVILYGTSPARLAEAAEVAAGLGLMTWLSPRLPDAPAGATLEAVAAAAEAAEVVRGSGGDVGLIVGCELSIFMAGIVPGADVLARADALNTVPAGSWDAPLGAFLADAVAEARGGFGGPVTYSAGTWEAVDWAPFDAVGANLYRDAHNATTHADELRRLFDHGPPVLITEFGCASYQGAQDKGPTGDDVIDWTGAVPRLVGPPVRDEQVQADHLVELLDLFEAEGAAGSYVFQFIAPATPYSPDPVHDLDMASLTLVRVDAPGTPDAYDTTGRWTPKAAFDALAAR
jgi:hypothetical protein